MLLKVGKEWLLFDGEWAARRLGVAARDELLSSAAWHGKVFDKQELRECLITLWNRFQSESARGSNESARENPKHEERFACA
jgi:hypothetical protein